MNDRYKVIIFLFAIFILAFGIRGNLLQYDNFFEYDQFFHARMTADIVQQGHVNNPDMLAYYQIGGAPQTVTSPVWIMSAGIYQGLFGWNVGYNYDLFTKLLQLLPVIFGSLICIVVYFIGKAVSNGKHSVGAIAGLVAAITPAFVYRTMAGAQFDNSFGFLPFSLGILFMIWALQEGKRNYKTGTLTILAGVCFMSMVFAWSVYLIVPLVLLPFFLYYAISRLMVDKDKEKDIVNSLSIAFIYVIFNLGCWISGFDWPSAAASFIGAPTLLLQLAGILIPIVGIILIVFRPSLKEDNRKMIYAVIAVGLIISCLGIAYFTTLNVDPVDRTSTGAMVGEESIGNSFFTQKYNIYNIFIPLAFICGIGLFIWKKSKYDFMPLLLATFSILFVMAWVKLKFTFVLGYGMIFAAIIIAILFYELWMHMKDKNKLEMKLIFIPSIFILLIGIAAGGVFILDYVPSVDSDPALQSVIEFLKTQTPEDSKILNNWGQGHILTYTTGRAVSADNRNHYTADTIGLPNKQFAEFENNSDSNYVYNMVSEMDVDYVLVQLTHFRMMQTNEFYIHNRVDGSLGNDFRVPFINIVNCTKEGTILSCAASGDIDSSIYSTWSETPYDFYEGQYPLFLYTVGSKVIILNQAANNTNLAKVLTIHPDTVGKYETVFQSGDYIILKVNKGL